MKIVILGAFGYIGSSLSRLYCNSRDEIHVVDSRVCLDKIIEFTDYGFKYHIRDIFDTASIIWDADMIYNLVSVTQVPQIVSQATKEIDDEIWRIGTEGNRYVMKNTDSWCRYIFPSSHVIMEGLTQETLDIDENFEPCPVLAYGKSKRQSELDLINSDKNYIIGRLGSVYGYNGSTTRHKILPNLFSLMSAQGKKLKVFGGNNLKPLIGVEDLAKSLKILAESPFKRDIYNLVSESARVREIAELCKKYSGVEVEETQAEVPNSGYTLSNMKILQTGFKFKQDLDTEIGRMIERFSEK